MGSMATASDEQEIIVPVMSRENFKGEEEKENFFSKKKTPKVILSNNT
jgi:hypothetical protein